MIKKHILSIGVSISLVLLGVGAMRYPGGSQKDAHSVRYDLSNNYLCNLFNEKAVNGAMNVGRCWAIAGMFCLCLTISAFFYRFSAKISAPVSAGIVKYFGMAAMFFSFFIITSYHDLMTTFSSILGLVSLFYMTVYILKSKILVFKILIVSCLAMLCLENYIYYTHHGLEYLPILQKVSLLIVLGLMLGLDYFTKREDFAAK